MMKVNLFLFSSVFVYLAIVHPKVAHAQEKTCIFVNSYSPGYHWSDEIDRGVVAGLDGACKLERLFLDSKKNKDKDSQKAKSLELKTIIDQRNPDVVIVSDDNAVELVLAQHYKNSKIPFVFCGLNWDITPYGLPYKNTTGMVEVAPIGPLFAEARKATEQKLKTVSFIAADNETQRKEFARVEKYFLAAKVEITPLWIKNFEQFKKAYVDAQQSDFVLLWNTAGADGWKDSDAKDWILKNTKKLSASVYENMIPFAGISFVKLGFEQGEYAGNAAAQILEGKPAREIKVIQNSRFDRYLNKEVTAKASVQPSAEFVASAKPHTEWLNQSASKK